MHRLFKDSNFVRLCVVTFFMTSCQQLIWVVMPFIVKSLGGSDTDVGICFMSQMSVYVVFCIWAGFTADAICPKKVLLIGSAAQVAVTAGITAVVWLKANLIISPIQQLVLLMAVIGIITAFYWPVMMGWISQGHNGAELTRRFGFYNVTWGTANMLLPVVGGYLMEINYLTALWAAVLMITVCLLFVFTLAKPQPSAAGKPLNQSQTAEIVSPQNQKFVWMSRIALLSTYICIGMYRSQLGILYKYQLGFGESAYGWSVSAMCLCNVAVFFLMGKSHWWHHKKTFFSLSQLLIIISMVMIVFSRNVFVQISTAALAGLTYSAVYSSHQYYGVCGGTRRAGRMAIHETIIGAGYAIGSVAGGIISDNFGRFCPYIFGCVLMALTGAAELILWFTIPYENQNSSKEKTSLLTSPA